VPEIRLRGQLYFSVNLEMKTSGSWWFLDMEPIAKEEFKTEKYKLNNG
jgi:hypothetical protein